MSRSAFQILRFCIYEFYHTAALNLWRESVIKIFYNCRKTQPRPVAKHLSPRHLVHGNWTHDKLSDEGRCWERDVMSSALNYLKVYLPHFPCDCHSGISDCLYATLVCDSLVNVAIRPLHSCQWITSFKVTIARKTRMGGNDLYMKSATSEPKTC